MADITTKTEYQTLKFEVEALKKKVERLEEIIRRAQRKKQEEEILAIAREAKELAEKGELPVLKSLKDLR